MGLALAAFARDAGIGPGKRAVLVLDRAGWHTGGRLKVPEGGHPAFLPPAPPERQPAERPWPLLDEPVANRAFAHLAELETVLVARCRVLEADRRARTARNRVHWWPPKRRRRRPRRPLGFRLNRGGGR